MTFPDITRLPLRQLVAQTIVVRTTGFLFDYQLQYPQWEVDSATLQDLIENEGIGGVILLGGSTAEIALKNQQMQSWAKIPLLICADIEEGVGQRFPGATWFPPPMALAGVAQQNLALAIDLAEKMGTTIAQECLAIGINWLLTPTVDVNNNPHNPVINVRAFGETPDVVSELTCAYIRGAKQAGGLTTAKHFPGHGDTAIDSHWELPTIEHDLARLHQVELAPFKRAIAAGVDSVMSAHLNVPAFDPDHPTTFSHKVMTDLLRGEMGFEGLIVTDALTMGAIADRYGNAESVIQSIEAGVDVLMMPTDVKGAIDALCAAVESGRLMRSQIEASVERIWQMKQCIAPPNSVTANHLIQTLAQPESMGTANAIVQHSIDRRNFTPITKVDHGKNLILTDTLLDSRLIGRLSPAVTMPPKYGFGQLEIVDRNTPTWHSTTNAATILQLFIRGNPLRGIQDSVEQAQAMLKQLLETQQLQALLLYGSPYVFDTFVELVPESVPCVFSYGQMPIAQGIVLEQLFSQEQVALNNKDGMF
jgi:beta-glucosidase